MGAYIVQDDKPVAFWSCKLNDAQLKYTVGDKELLSIVIVLTEFCTMFSWYSILAWLPQRVHPF